jgi:transglutaminase-like putative cysteine protease
MPFYPTNPRPMRLGSVSSGPAGTAQTLKVMVKLAREGAKDPGVIQVASNLVRNVDQYDRAGEIRALHGFVRDSIRYTNDPVDMELVRTPRAILEMGVGDCDDKSILLASLLRCIGRPSRYVAICLSGPSGYSHVYVETPMGKRWICLETIRPVEAGWEPQGVIRRMVVHV